MWGGLIGGENAGEDEGQHGIVALENRIRLFSECAVVVAAMVHIGIFVHDKELISDESHFLEACSIFAAITCAAGFVLRFLITESVGAANASSQYVAIKLLVHVCTLSLMITAYILLLLMDYEDTTLMNLTAILVATLVVVLCYKAVRRSQDHDIAVFFGYEWRLDRLLDFSVDLMYMSFAGSVGRVFGYFNNFDEQVAPSCLEAFEIIISFSSLFSTLSMALNTLPPPINVNSPGARQRLLGVLDHFTVFSAVMTMAADLALLLGQEDEHMILATMTALAVIGIFIFPAIQYDRPGLDGALGGLFLSVFLNILTNTSSHYHGDSLLISFAVLGRLKWRLRLHRPPKIATAWYFVSAVISLLVTFDRDIEIINMDYFD